MIFGAFCLCGWNVQNNSHLIFDLLCDMNYHTLMMRVTKNNVDEVVRIVGLKTDAGMLCTASVGCLVLLVGCGASHAAGSTDTSSGSSSNASKTIVYLNHNTGPGEKHDQQLAKQFEQLHPGIHVTLDEVQTGQTFAKFQTMVASGQPPNVYDLNGTYISQAIQDGALAPVDYSALGVNGMSQLSGKYITGALNAYTANGTLYGVPEEISDYQGFVNTKALSDAGITKTPSTWSELFADASKLTKKNSKGQITQEEIALPLNFPAAEYLVVDALARENGSGLFNAAGTKSNLTSPAVIKAFQELQDLVYKYHAFYPKLNGTKTGSERDLFGESKAVMILDSGVWYQPYLKENYPSVWKTTSVVPYPIDSGKTPTTDSYGYAWVVPKQASNQKLSWEFINFLQQNGLQIFKTGGEFNGTTSLGSSKAVTQTKFWTSDWLPSLNSAKPSVSLKNNSQIQDIINQAYDSILLNHADVKSALASADAQIKQLLNK